MIEDKNIIKVGCFTKTHGVNGELNVLLEIDPAFFGTHDCFLCYEEGIPTPFFIDTFRVKGQQSALIKPLDINSEVEAKSFVGKDLFVDKSLYKMFALENSEDDGEFASDLVGWTIVNDNTNELIGTIADINLDTINALFIVNTPQGDTIMIPIAEDFISAINEDHTQIRMCLPNGLTELNLKNN